MKILWRRPVKIIHQEHAIPYQTFLFPKKTQTLKCREIKTEMNVLWMSVQVIKQMVSVPSATCDTLSNILVLKQNRMFYEYQYRGDRTVVFVPSGIKLFRNMCSPLSPIYKYGKSRRCEGKIKELINISLKSKQTRLNKNTVWE